jgi:hypothetical protein
MVVSNTPCAIVISRTINFPEDFLSEILNLFSSHLVSAQLSLPYSRMGHNKVLYSLSVSFFVEEV